MQLQRQKRSPKTCDVQEIQCRLLAPFFPAECVSAKIEVFNADVFTSGFPNFKQQKLSHAHAPGLKRGVVGQQMP